MPKGMAQENANVGSLPKCSRSRCGRTRQCRFERHREPANPDDFTCGKTFDVELSAGRRGDALADQLGTAVERVQALRPARRQAPLTVGAPPARGLRGSNQSGPSGRARPALLMKSRRFMDTLLKVESGRLYAASERIFNFPAMVIPSTRIDRWCASRA